MVELETGMKMNPIHLLPTRRQRDVLSFCMAYQSAHGKFPTTRTIQRHFKWRSQNAAVTFLKQLVRKGRLGHHPGGYSIIYPTTQALTKP